MRLHVEEFGDAAGSPLVCLHGLSGYGARFRRLAGLLPGRRLVAPDLRGHGASGREPPWDVETHVADVVATVDSLGLGRCDWLGFSFGGLVLATLAAADAARVERVCLLDPAMGLPTDLCQEHATAELEGETFSSPAAAIEAELSSGALQRTPREVLEEEMELNLVQRPDGRFEYRYSREMAIAAWSEMAREPPAVADVPTLIVTGKQSWIPVDVDRYQDAVTRLLYLARVPGGHSVLWEALDETAWELNQFLSE